MAAFPPFIIGSPAMLEIVAAIELARESMASVLITGETGTGKELLSRAVHVLSNRCDQQFIAFDCADVSRELIESELFGHRRGSFTGATRDRKGVIREANRGTLFLDEIGELSLKMQSKFLRFLQEREVRPVGADRPIKVDVRVIAATNRDLEAEVRAGRFRADLYERLNVLRLRVPPLRERREEIPLQPAI
jgi:transcriptional regulator with GAF, ATPase, and Fis domain